MTLTWEAVTGASDYIVEAGSSSGASNLAQIRTGGELHLVVDEVPSGTYFVHVRATNQVGTTAVSRTDGGRAVGLRTRLIRSRVPGAARELSK